MYHEDKKMIISASRRTDIPCYYNEWFMNRIHAGYLLTRNPMNHSQISRITLSPKIVDCIVFWTKDAKNIIPHLKELDQLGYKYYFQFTLNPYDRSIEPNLRDKDDIIDTFIELSKLIGKERIIWRYDPIILNDICDIDYHKTQFERMCKKLYTYTEKVIISFVDMYAKVKTPLISPLREDEIIELSEYVGKTAKAYGLPVYACCESMDLSPYGILKSSCIDKDTIERVCDIKLDLKQDKNQRNGCGCYQSIDIGAYDTCANGCIYCYANKNHKNSEKRYLTHNPKNELLIGTVLENGVVKEREQKSDRIY